MGVCAFTVNTEYLHEMKKTTFQPWCEDKVYLNFHMGLTAQANPNGISLPPLVRHEMVFKTGDQVLFVESPILFYLLCFTLFSNMSVGKIKSDQQGLTNLTSSAISHVIGLIPIIFHMQNQVGSA